MTRKPLTQRFFDHRASDHLRDWSLLLLRVVFGLSMLYGHGLGKVTRLFGTEEIKFADPFGIGPEASLALVVFAEVICSLLVVVGLFTRAALIPLIITMAVALLYVHLSDPFGRQEKAILFGFAYLSLLLQGPGKWSLDYIFFSKKE